MRLVLTHYKKPGLLGEDQVPGAESKFTQGFYRSASAGLKGQFTQIAPLSCRQFSYPSFSFFGKRNSFSKLLTVRFVEKKIKFNWNVVCESI